MARFKREIFLNTTDDCAWLKSTHLKAETRPFGGFTLSGNEDAPDRIDLYAARKPEYNEQPFAVYQQNDEGDLYDTLAPVKPRVIRRIPTPAPSAAKHVIRRTKS